MISGHWEGLDKAISSLRELPQKFQTKILRPAINYALTPALASIKAAAPVATGTLKKNLLKKISTKRGRVRGIIGGSKEHIQVGSKVYVPAWYAGPVESGARPHMVGKRKHPGIAPHPFIASGGDSVKQTMIGRLIQKIQEGITKLLQ